MLNSSHPQGYGSAIQESYRKQSSLSCFKVHQTSPWGHLGMILYWLQIWNTVGFSGHRWPCRWHIMTQTGLFAEKKCAPHQHLSTCPRATDVALIWLVLLDVCWGNNCVKLIWSQRFHANYYMILHWLVVNTPSKLCKWQLQNYWQQIMTFIYIQHLKTTKVLSVLRVKIFNRRNLR